MYPSPQVDFGYDISDYESVDPQYGTLADLDRLIAEAKKHNIRILLDMVLNHTSDKHQWFIESASSRNNPKHDWYVWNDGIARRRSRRHHLSEAFRARWKSPSATTGSRSSAARPGSGFPRCTSSTTTSSTSSSPTSTGATRRSRRPCSDSMQFWLDRGVAGFRLDAIPTLFEDPQLRNKPETGGINAQGDPNLQDIYTNNLPEVHDVIRRMRAMVAKYPGDRVLIGETYLPNTAELDKWYGGAAQDELQLPMDMLVGFHGDHDKLKRHHLPPAHLTRSRRRSTARSRSSSSTTTTTSALAIATATASHNDGDHQAPRHHALHHAGHRADVLRRRARHAHHHAHAPRRRQGPHRHHRLAQGKGPRRRAHAHAVGRPDPQAGFSTNPNTWLPIPPNYKTINVQAESPIPPRC